MSDGLVKRLRGGIGNTAVVTIAGCMHSTDCLEAADRIEELESKLAKAVEALSSTRRADDLREAYHRLPNDKNRIGDKKSKKSRARDVWLRSFRKAAKEARAVLRSTEASHD